MKMQRQIIFSSLLLLTLASSKVLAHNVQTNVDVGITFHIEPDHSPRVGEESQAWFALTRRGGELIPLSECDCDLKVYLESQGESADEPILNPTLIAISPERYQNIPGANIVFPQPGIYQLELTGKPIQEGDFTPFQVSYPVTVSPGNSANKKIENQLLETNKLENKQPVASSPEQIDNNQETIPKSSQIYPWLVGILAGGLGITALLKLFRK